MDYYSVDSIQTEGELVPSTFNVTVPGLGFLIGEEGDIEAGTEVELPLWLAVPLASSRISSDSDIAFIDIGEPRAFEMDVLNSLKSDPKSVDLRALSPEFTYLALYWLQLFASEELAVTLQKTIQSRTGEIFSAAAAKRQATESLITLDEYERSLYKIASLSTRDVLDFDKS